MEGGSRRVYSNRRNVDGNGSGNDNNDHQYGG